jgi:hypothetical protein
LARFDEAEQAARELQRINPDSPGVHFSNYFFAFFRRDQAAMDREVQWARGKPEEAQLISYLAITAMYFGYWNLCEAMRVVQLPVWDPITAWILLSSAAQGQRSHRRIEKDH